MNNNLEFENEDPSPDSIEDNHPRTNYGEGYGGKETPEEAASKWSLEEAQEFALSRFKNENLLLEGFVSLESILKVFKAGILTGHKFGAKWQQEQNKKLYSEEEVLELLHKRMSYTLGAEYKKETTLEWFEQFKT